ncbi:Asp-tRNA(Asn)/Glu-tRNA(Gln) amidotransferase GatCAB subunit A [soil metagenome]
MSDPATLSLAAAASALARAELSATELLDACLRRVEQLEPAVRAFVTLDLEGARARAREQTSHDPQCPLHGIPVGVKDLIDVAGLPTTASSRVLAGNVAATDAPVVSHLRRAGAMVMGKTNTQEFAYGVVSAPTRNPWDLERIPGGSSGGSAAAVAAGMCPGALGSDTAGSVRIPSSLCGITGLTPRQRVVPMAGIVPLAWSIDVWGPMAADAASVERMWRGLTGAAPISPRLEGLVMATPSWDSTGADYEVLELVDQAVEVLSRLAPRSEVALPVFTDWDRPHGIFLASEALTAHRQANWYPDRLDDYTDETRSALRHAESFTAVDFVSARRELERLGAAWKAALEHTDLLVLPTTEMAAPRVDELGALEGKGFRPEVAVNLTRLCRPTNFLGLAAVSVPCGFTPTGMPVGLQLVARDEATALGAALAYQELSDWHTRRPPLAG